MGDRRYEFRKPCTDSVEVQWQDQKGRARKDLGNLEDISITGLCLHLAHPISFGTRLRIVYQSHEFRGKVRYCVLRSGEHVIGVKFDPGCEWSPELATSGVQGAPNES
jgi:hypothetical protein